MGKFIPGGPVSGRRSTFAVNTPTIPVVWFDRTIARVTWKPDTHERERGSCRKRFINLIELLKPAIIADISTFRYGFCRNDNAK